MAAPPIRLRPATSADIPALGELIIASVRSLGAAHYSSEQIEASLVSVFGVDSQLIADGTYFVAEIGGRLVGAGGWSRRQTLFGGDQRKAAGIDDRVDPATSPGRIRAFYIHPEFARRGIARALLTHCEDEARAGGFRTLELLATLPGVPLYLATGYMSAGPLDIEMGNGLILPGVRMWKSLF